MTISKYTTYTGNTIHGQIENVVSRMDELRKDLEKLKHNTPICGNKTEGIKILEERLKEEEKKLNNLNNTWYVKLEDIEEE